MKGGWTKALEATLVQRGEVVPPALRRLGEALDAAGAAWGNDELAGLLVGLGGGFLKSIDAVKEMRAKVKREGSA